jgi:WD40 repeat protein
MARTSSRSKVAAVAAPIAALLIGGLILMRFLSDRPRTLEGHAGHINSVAFSPDSRMIAGGDSEGNIKLWDTANGQWIRTLNSYHNTDWIAFSPDGRTLASSGGSSGNSLLLWDTVSASQLHVLAYNSGFIGQAAFSRDGRILAASVGNKGTADHALRLWDPNSGNELRRFPDYELPVFSPDGKLVAAENKSHSISLLDRESGNELRTIGVNLAALQKFIFSPDGRLLATWDFEKATVTLWDVVSGAEVRKVNDSAPVRGMAFSADSRLLASGSEDHTVKLWDVASGNKIRTFTGPSEAINSVAFSPDGRWLASGGADGNIFLWPLRQSR